ncbi:murein L,D-transpeptidase catalytic domain family protein [Rhizobium changzhiense]|uniref:Murein L,D-transpeptidase catalytic domain family protein n=1 Tax=Rhizobium changzhiense TaxID=2692317 RepID=A0ABR6A122_9HYPH|nr:murein L,D-transpeptidase catalytic domain family protein [Rhizobium changzhiense]MBA5800324.1 murein L,D-transpeptidase catalytic domain family protein [Rhizobium changzhiense]
MARALQTTNDSILMHQVLTQLEATLEATNSVVQDLLRNHEPGAPFAASHMKSLPDAAFFAKGGRAERGVEEPILMTLAEDAELELPMKRLIALRNERYQESHPRYWAIANFDLHSSKPRLFVFDVIANETSSYLCSHGRGSEGPTDDGIADVFSNVEGSKATSLGIYRCAETYQGENGYSLKLDGLEETNSRARSRAIVIHGADYVSLRFSQQYGRIGRSEGCPALDQLVARKVIDQLKQGSLLMHWKTP